MSSPDDLTSHSSTPRDDLIEWADYHGYVQNGEFPTPRPVYELNDRLLRPFLHLWEDGVTAQKGLADAVAELEPFLTSSTMSMLGGPQTTLQADLDRLTKPSLLPILSVNGNIQGFSVDRAEIERDITACSNVRDAVYGARTVVNALFDASNLSLEQHDEYTKASDKIDGLLAIEMRRQALATEYCLTIGLLSDHEPTEEWLDKTYNDPEIGTSTRCTWTGRYETSQPQKFWRAYFDLNQNMVTAYDKATEAVELLPRTIQPVPLGAVEGIIQGSGGDPDFLTQLKRASQQARLWSLPAIGQRYNIDDKKVYTVKDTLLERYQGKLEYVKTLMDTDASSLKHGMSSEGSRALHETQMALERFLSASHDMIDHVRTWNRIHEVQTSDADEAV